MTDRSVLIIGAGVGGLSAGCYAQMNGYRTRILEMYARPGGVCTSWTREDYIFDGCVHNLAGTSPDSRFRPMWRELGVLPRIRMHRFDELVSIERPDGPPFTVYTDLNRLQAHMKRLSLGDGDHIDELISTARWFSGFDIMGLSLAPPLERATALVRAAPMLLKWGALTLETYARRYRDPFLRRALPTMIYDWPDQSMLTALYFLGRASVGDLGWPQGGAQELSEAIADRFEVLGGEVQYQSRVQSILVEQGRAVGVRLDDGREARADIVISNANGFETIFGMLGGRHTTPAIRAHYAAPLDRCEMGLHVSLGLARDLSEEPHAIVLPLDPPVEIAGERRERLYVEPFGFDSTLAPQGKSPLKVVLATSFRRWEELSRRPDAYAAEKARIADVVIALLDARFPGLTQQLEVVDVATPATTLRFTRNGRGYRTSVVGAMLSLLAGRRLSETLPGLRNFHMVGQWAGAPGIPMVAAMGRDVVRRMCRADGRAFRTAPEAPGSGARGPAPAGPTGSPSSRSSWSGSRPSRPG